MTGSIRIHGGQWYTTSSASTLLSNQQRCSLAFFVRANQSTGTGAPAAAGGSRMVTC